jgi:hypothetical protein
MLNVRDRSVNTVDHVVAKICKGFVVGAGIIIVFHWHFAIWMLVVSLSFDICMRIWMWRWAVNINIFVFVDLKLWLWLRKLYLSHLLDFQVGKDWIRRKYLVWRLQNGIRLISQYLHLILNIYACLNTVTSVAQFSLIVGIFWLIFNQTILAFIQRSLSMNWSISNRMDTLIRSI